MKDQDFKIQSAGIDTIFAIIEWASFRFLAITTAVMAGNVYYPFFTNNGMSPKAAMIMNLIAIGITYLIIDHGLPSLLRFVRKHKGSSDEKKRKLIRMVGLFVTIRLLLTATSSWWAAAEISDMTVKDDTQYYVDAKLKQDSLYSIRYNNAVSDKSSLVSSEDNRIQKAEIEKARLIRESVNQGSFHQKDMWKRNPNFFRSLNPKSKYYNSNKAFADKVFAAEAEGNALIQAERNKTSNARQFADQLTSTGDTLSSTLSTIAIKRQEQIDAKRARRKNLLWVIDVIATVFGVFAVTVRVRREDVAGVETNNRNLSHTLSKYTEKTKNDFLDWIEDILNIDIDGDGAIGAATMKKVDGYKDAVSTASTTGATAETRTVVRGFVSDKTKGGAYCATTPATPAQKSATTPVQQDVQSLETKSKQADETNETKKVQQGETVVLVDNNKRYLKQRCKQSYKRMHKQDDPTTPEKNYKKFRQMLEALGIEVTEITDEKGNPSLSYKE